MPGPFGVVGLISNEHLLHIINPFTFLYNAQFTLQSQQFFIICVVIHPFVVSPW